MRKMKKLLSILMAATMTLAMAAPAFAAGTGDGGDDTSTGTITITNATVDKEYTAYKLFDANPAGGEDGLIAYTTTKAVSDWFTGQGGNPFKFEQVGEADLYNVGLIEGATDTVVTEFLQSLVVGEDNEIDPDADFFTQFQPAATKTAEAAEVVLSVPYGYYMVTSSLGAVVSVDYTNKDAVILDKNQSGPSWNEEEDPDAGKKIVEDNKTMTDISSADYGDTVDFQIRFTTTNYHGEKEIYNYYVYDKLGEGLAYDKDTLTVKVGEDELSDSGFTVDWDDEKNGFTVDIPWSTDKASPNKITVNYSATVTDKAVIAGDGNKNTAWFTFKEKDPGTTPDPDEPEVKYENVERETTTYVYALGINKTDAAGNGLAGATFALTDENGNAINVSGGTDGVYQYDKTATSNTVVSPEGGVIKIKGLAAGRYILTETAAPAGYNRVVDPVTIEAKIAETSTYKATYHYTYVDGTITEVEEAGEHVTTVRSDFPLVLENVINYAGAMLPSTGGIGTTVFYAAGILLMAGAVFFVVRRKRA